MSFLFLHYPSQTRMTITQTHLINVRLFLPAFLSFPNVPPSTNQPTHKVNGMADSITNQPQWWPQKNGEGSTLFYSIHIMFNRCIIISFIPAFSFFRPTRRRPPISQQVRAAERGLPSPTNHTSDHKKGVGKTLFFSIHIMFNQCILILFHHECLSFHTPIVPPFTIIH